MTKSVLKQLVNSRLVTVIPERQRALLNSIWRLTTSSPKPTIPDPISFLENNEIPCVRQGPQLQGVSVIFTTSRGVHLFDSKRETATRILGGRVYGITRYKDRWIIGRTSNRKAEKAKRLSDIYSLKIADSQVQQINHLVFGIPGEVHQIDVAEGILYIPNTGFNQLLCTSLDTLFQHKRHPRYYAFALETKEFDIFHPSHLNSVFVDSNARKIYLVAHNLTAHTGRNSDLLIYDQSTSKLRIIPTNANSAHNIYVEEDDLIYCDSNNRQLFKGEHSIFTSDKLLRGLSVTEDHIFVGGSDISFDRDTRYSSDATIYILKRSGQLLTRYDFPEVGNLYEIRQFHGRDYALSST